MAITTKTFGDTYLFNKYGEYNNKLMQFIMSNDEIDTSSDEFADVLFDIKRQNIGVSIVNVATSKNIKLMYGNIKLPSQFKVFAAKDIKGKDSKALKVYIDCTDVLKKDGGKYVCRNMDILLSYLINAMTTLIYHANVWRLTSQVSFLDTGARAFAALFTHVIDYIFKISINPELKATCNYLATRFYWEYILQNKDSSANSTVLISARKNSGISEREERLINIGCNDKSFSSLEDFVETINHVLKVNLTLDAFVDKWMFIYGPSTVFALEFFPAFAAMLTDAYCGGYLNNQKTIEKIAGKHMVSFAHLLFDLGDMEINAKR